MSKRRYRLAICGASGSGKTTFAELLGRHLRWRGFGISRVQIARPLYELQSQVYRVARTPIRSSEFQDTELLSFLGGHIRRINPSALLFEFEENLAKESERFENEQRKKSAIICADARLPDLSRLCELEFRFLYISAPMAHLAQRTRSRGDSNAGKTNPQLEVTETSWPWCLQIDNSGPLSRLDTMAHELAAAIDADDTILNGQQ